MKFSVIGVLFWIAAAVIGGFKGICFIMEKELHIFTIEQILGEEKAAELLMQITWPQGREWAQVLSVTQIWMLLMAIGLFFIIIGLFKKD